MTSSPSPLAVPNPNERKDLGTFVRSVVRMSAEAVLRIVPAESAGAIRVFATTPFEALVSRTVTGSIHAPELFCSADVLLVAVDAVPESDPEGQLEPGMPFASAWPGSLPPANSLFTEIDRVPAQVLLDLAAKGRETAQEDGGPAGLAPSLLDQVVLKVTSTQSGVNSTSGRTSASIDMRMVFALDGIGAIPRREGRAPQDEPTRVSVAASWTRIDARYGSVYRHAAPALSLSVR